PGVSYLFRVTPKTLAGYPDSENLNVRGRSFPFLHYKTPSEVHSSPPPIFVNDIHLENVGQSKSPAYKIIVTATVQPNSVFDKWIKNFQIVFGTLDSIFIEDKTVMDVDWSFNEDKSLVVDLPNVFHQATVECDPDGDSTFDFSFARVIHASTFGNINQSINSVISNHLLATVNDLKCSLSIDSTNFPTDSLVNFSVVLNWRIDDISVAGYHIRLWINDKPYREILINNGTENKLFLNDLSPKNLLIKFSMRSIFSPDRFSWFTYEKICNFPPDLENFTIYMPEKIDVTVLNDTTVNLTFAEPQYLNLIAVEHTKDEYLLYKVRYSNNDNFSEIYLPNVGEKSCDRVTLVLDNLKPGSSYKLNIAAPDKLGRWGPFSHDCFFQTPLLDNGTIFQCHLISGPPPENNFPNRKRLIISFCIIFLCLMICLTIYWRYGIYRRRNETTATNSKFCLINFLSTFRETNKNSNGSRKKRFSSSSDCNRHSIMVQEATEIASVKYCNGISAENRNGVDIDKPLLENGNFTAVSLKYLKVNISILCLISRKLIFLSAVTNDFRIFCLHCCSDWSIDSTLINSSRCSKIR
uniref:Fibronectin type-III domain-containing protein n=1 Tax=Romanomermis culicivorax TaxID=13658 RepID=A0A915IJD1_ROMCU